MKDLDWSNLSFGYRQTDYNVRCYYRDGKWGEIEVCSDEYLKLHMAATCLHYGQEAFEGLKAYRCPDGKVRVFRMDENAARLQSTCRGIMMPEVPTEMFEEMVKKVVRLNQEWIPTYESGATLYIRPLLIGTSAQVGVHPSKEYCFLIFVTPVGPYFKGGFSTNPYVIIRDFDRKQFEARKRKMMEIAKKVGKGLHPDCYIELVIEDSYYNMREKVVEHPHILDIAQQAMRDCDIEPELKPIRGGTDGAQLSFMGLPCPNLFTGGYNYHGKHEFVTLEGMEKAVQVIVRIAELTAQRK